MVSAALAALPRHIACPAVHLQAMLAIGAAMLGAQHVVGVDVDEDALRVAQQNVEEYEDYLPVRVWLLFGGRCVFYVWRQMEPTCTTIAAGVSVGRWPARRRWCSRMWRRARNACR